MERKISDIIDTIQKCNREELDLLVERFHPLIKKYSRELPYEEAETDLVIFFINLIDKINLEKFKTKGEGALVNFIRNSLRMLTSYEFST